MYGIGGKGVNNVCFSVVKCVFYVGLVRFCFTFY